MRVAYTPEQQALRDEVRAYFKKVYPPEVREELGPNIGEHQGTRFREIVRQLGRDGWLGVGWPKEYGGRGFTAIEQYIFFDEARRVHAPLPVVTLNTVGPTLMQFGTEEQKQRFLPAILRGECHFAIGYSEPGAGTDLASLTTRAVRDSDGYVINGQKIFTTGAHDADFVWLAARTDPDAPKHKGISVFMVDTSSPGFKTTPIVNMDDGRTNTTYFEDVFVPESMRVGKENSGWKLMTTQLNHERVALSCPGKAQELFEDTLAWARETGVIQQPWVQLVMARLHARLDALKLLNWKMAFDLTTGEPNPADASAVKVYGTELFVEVFQQLLDVVGAGGALKEGSSGAVLRGRLEHIYRAAFVLTFGGGVNEVQRDIIATVGLGLPRSKR